MDQRFTRSSDYMDGFNFNDDLVLPYFDQYPYPTTNGSEFEAPNLNLNSTEPPLKAQSDTSSSLSWIVDADQNPSLNLDSESGLSSNTSLSFLTWSPETDLSDSDLSSSLSPEGDSLPSSTLSEESYSDPMLKYIQEMLMEENMDEKALMVHDSLALQATQDSLHEILAGNNHPPSSNRPSVDVNHNTWSPDDTQDLHPSPPVEVHTTSQLSVNELLIQNMFSDKESILQFQRGVEEARKFLPNSNQLTIDLSNNTSSKSESWARKNHQREDRDSGQGRTKKQPAVYIDESELSQVFDKVLLFGPKPDQSSCCQCDDAAWNEAKHNLLLAKGPKGGSKRQSKKAGESVDLRSLLILSAQAVSSDDRRTATELLKQIRQHSSPSGNASQRMAHYFANGLEARLAGTGTKVYPAACMGLERTSIADILKAFHLYLLCCPFKRLAIGMTIKTILSLSEKATTIHLVDFGIGYGFQWPTLIWNLAYRAGGPPKLRITGIDLPQPGFRPEEGIKQAGRRLANYCERFKVPFEYNTIASQNWETIKLEDINIREGEAVFVNSLFRSHNLLDETVEKDSPRDAVLNLIREMKPVAFTHSVASASYNSPFFVTRFREALFHYSALFDMFDTAVSRDTEERTMCEREFYGREVMNVISCEGLERIERPETYKQWQVRSRNAGLRQLAMDQEIMAKVKGGKLKSYGYHKDFVVDEASNWMLQGWKGRILCASSCWTAN